MTPSSSAITGLYLPDNKTWQIENFHGQIGPDIGSQDHINFNQYCIVFIHTSQPGNTKQFQNIFDITCICRLSDTFSKCSDKT